MSGNLTESEKMKCEDSFDEMREAFREYDKNGDGYITKEELKIVLANFGEAHTDDKVKDMIRDLDTDGDGRISYEEFVNKIK